jgi:hypothetical protein
MERPIRVRVLLNLISFVIAKRVQLEKEKEIAAAKKKKKKVRERASKTRIWKLSEY